MGDDFFAGLEQELSNQQKQSIAQNVYSQLEDRVGDKLQAQLSDQQYDDFEKVVESGHDQEIADWLANNAPGYQKLVDDTLEQLKQEVKADPNKFLAL